MIGTPSSRWWSTVSSFSASGSFDANTPASCSCSAVNTFTPKRPASRTIGSVRASLAKHTSASSGSSDSAHTALAVIPPDPPPPARATQGSAVNVRTAEYNNGPNFNIRGERPVTRVLYAIENGGFSGAIMPQNVVVGQQAIDVAEFVATYAGRQAPKLPGQQVCTQKP